MEKITRNIKPFIVDYSINETNKGELEHPVVAKPLGDVNVFRRLISMLPGFCAYCGKRYVDCHSHKIDLLFPIPQNGRVCPDGHEGYTDQYVIFGGAHRTYFDNMIKEE